MHGREVGAVLGFEGLSERFGLIHKEFRINGFRGCRLQP